MHVRFGMSIYVQENQRVEGCGLHVIFGKLKVWERIHKLIGKGIRWNNLHRRFDNFVVEGAFNA